MGEKGPEWLQPQQALGVAAQNGVPLFWGEGQGADRGHIGGLVPPGAVGAEEEAPGPKFSDKADKLLLFHHVQLVLRKRVSLQGGEVAVGKGGIQQHAGRGEQGLYLVPLSPACLLYTSIMVVGVGGQGSLRASKLLGHLLMEQGYDVKVSEVHGMSQRGGSVVTYVRYGDRVNSPVIDKGEADYIVSFELLEAARWLSYLKPDGQIVTSTQQIDPCLLYTSRCV